MLVTFKPCNRVDRAMCIREVIQEWSLLLHEQQIDFALDVNGAGYVTHSQGCKERHPTETKKNEERAKAEKQKSWTLSSDGKSNLFG